MSLSTAQEEYIASLVQDENETKAAVARRFDISPRTVGRIVDRVNVRKGNPEPPQPEESSVDASPETYSVVASFSSITINQHGGTTKDYDIGTVSETINEGDEGFDEVRDIVFGGKGSQESLADAFLKISKAEKLKQVIHGDLTIDYEWGSVRYKDRIIDGLLGERLLKASSHEEFESLCNFTELLYQNPSNRAVRETFKFLKAADIEIDPTGMVIAFKKVRSDYKDIFTGTFDNTPGTGEPVKVDRNMVDEDSNRTCSHGLHVCSKSYLGSYGGAPDNRIVKVLLNPKDVVAVPDDYNNAKMRLCEYFVLEDVTDSIRNH